MDTATRCDILNEAQALRALDWPTSRRPELRALADNRPCGRTRVYDRADIELLRSPLNQIVRAAVRGAFSTTH
jgi:hypothetical protein